MFAGLLRPTFAQKKGEWVHLFGFCAVNPSNTSIPIYVIH